MPNKPLSDDDLKAMRSGLSVWVEVQRQAGASDDDVVEIQGSVPPIRCSLKNFDELTAAYIEALPDLGEFDDEETPEAWAQNVGARVGIVGNGSDRRTAFLAVQIEYQHSRKWRFQNSRPRLLVASWDDETLQQGPWLDPLSQPKGMNAKQPKLDPELISLAGQVALLNAMGASTGIRKTTAGVVMLACAALPHMLDCKSSDATAIGAAFDDGDLEWLGLSHLRKLASLRFGERPELLAQRLLVRHPSFVEAAHKLKACGGNWELLLSLPGVVAPPKSVTFAVPGLIPTEVITLLAGAAGTGKSTLLHDLSIIVTTHKAERDPTRTWLGVPVADIRDGAAVFLSGEDGAAGVFDRGSQLSERGSPIRLMELTSDRRTLEDVLAEIDSVPDLALLVVDPARAFMSGSEDDSVYASEFMRPLGAFATRKGCAVVVVHHLKRNLNPTSPSGVLGALRGSQVFIDRPRCIIGLVRRRSVLTAAVIKHNIPTLYPMKEEPESFQMDAETLRVTPMQAVKARDTPRRLVENPESEVVGLVVAAIRAVPADVAVTLTGRRGIFELHLPELVGISRKTVRAAAEEAIACGRLRALPNRNLVVTGAPLPALPGAQNPLPATETLNATI